MKLFYHHVGVQGADRDFPKTVFTERSVQLILDAVPDQELAKAVVLEQVMRRFEGGMFNCWGVPQGAIRVIERLAVGDAVLLVRSIGESGTIPALATVRSYIPVKFPALSQALWGSEAYPYIFFFHTVPLSLTWEAFTREVGYAPNYDPRGRFLSVAEAALERWNGADEYVKHLAKEYGSSTPSSYSLSLDNPEELREATSTYDMKTAYEPVLVNSFQATPQLTDDAPLVTVKSTSVLRSPAFKRGVRLLYDNACAVCGLSVFTPDHKPEIQGAHIYPKRLNGSDDLRNGLGLCRMHHWALDSGWMSIADDQRLLVRADLPTKADYRFIGDFKDKPLRRPHVEEFAPHPLYLQAHRQHYGFE